MGHVAARAQHREGGTRVIALAHRICSSQAEHARLRGEQNCAVADVMLRPCSWRDLQEQLRGDASAVVWRRDEDVGASAHDAGSDGPTAGSDAFFSSVAVAS
jgi:hypothetical protein